VFCTFWLGNVLRATTACTFSASQLNFQKWSEPGVFCTLWLGNVLRATSCNFSSLICPAGSALAALASLLFDPAEPQIIGKTQCFATFLPTRAPGSSFFWDFLFFDLLSSSLLFAGSSHLCFSSVHIVGSLTSKLPSIICWYYISLKPSANFLFHSETTSLNVKTPTWHGWHHFWNHLPPPITHLPNGGLPGFQRYDM